jgi:hypothetical protein
MPAPMAEGKLGRTLRRAAEWREGRKHGHELKIRRPRRVRARALARRRAPPLLGRRRVGGATAPGARPQNRRSRDLFAEGHDPKEGGGLCPNHGSSRTKRISRARARSTSETFRSCFTCSRTRSSPRSRQGDGQTNRCQASAGATVNDQAESVSRISRSSVKDQVTPLRPASPGTRQLDGGPKGIRTPDLLAASQTLYQLSYGPGTRQCTQPDETASDSAHWTRGASRHSRSRS